VDRRAREFGVCILAGAPDAFLWDTSEPRPGENGVALGGAWWEQYFGGASRSGQLSATALQELAKASAELLTLLPNPRSWTRPPLFKGVVVGAVQSGKTQSMMGLAAAALDAGYKLVLVLGGVRDDLRTQTAKRFNASLLFQSDPIPGRRGATTLGGATGPKGSARGFAPPYNVDCHNYAPLLPKLINSLERGAPCVVVIKKHPASLNDMASVLTEVYNTLGSAAVPTLLLDDECDEATVPGSEDDLAVPSGILGLWGNAATQPHVAYVGYTATAAANLLQHPSWALYPHWVYLLRYAGSEDAPWQFPEPSSDRWYSGPECYFGDFGDSPGEGSNFLISATATDADLAGRVSDNGSLGEALRAYFVSGAYRLALNKTASFDDPDRYPSPHTMLVHTSVAQEDHARWAAGLQAELGQVAYPDGSAGFDVQVLTAKLQTEETLWRSWYDHLTASRERIYNERAHEQTQGFVSWEMVRAMLPLAFQHTRLKVVNSDDGSSSLDFSQPRDSNGRKLSPQDCFVVAIGGSRFSRGLTIEGLCVTYFARSAAMRHDDVVMQMNRWFGYRGSYIEFCRVFTSMRGFTSLREVSENDLALRGQLSLLMQKKMAPADATIVFHASPYSRPTAKMGAGILHDLTCFSPFTRVLSYVELGAQAQGNQEWALRALADIRARGGALIGVNHGKRSTSQANSIQSSRKLRSTAGGILMAA
jgi:hypothetical protein